jgi:murein L,D-transpeptidase YafK
MIATLLLAATVSIPAPSPCPERVTALVVDTSKRSMWRCEAGVALEELAVALGSGGVGKRRQGDAKVPLGEYSLGAPTRSKSYHLFIPVGYPTAAQRRAGFTGSAIGVHGPARGYESLGALNTSVDWTLGCIAVGSDPEIERVARWVRTKGVGRILIR